MKKRLSRFVRPSSSESDKKESEHYDSPADGQDVISCFSKDNVGLYLENFTSDKVDVEKLLEEMYQKMLGGRFTTLYRIKMANCSIGDSEFQRILSGYQEYISFSGIKDLIIDGQNIGDKGARYLSEIFFERQLNSLEMLSLPKNKIGNKGVKYLSDAFLKAGLGKLLEVNLSVNKISDSGLIYVVGGLKELSRFRSLNLNSNKIGDKGIKALMPLLQAGGVEALKDLKLENNLISDKIAKILFEFIEKEPKIIINKLHISNGSNLIAKVNADSFVETEFYKVLSNSSDTLRLMARGIGNIEIKDISFSMETIGGIGLRILMLQENRIDNEGVELLSSALKKLLSLEQIFLGFNWIDNTGVMVLINAVKHLPNLKKIDLSNNPITDIKQLLEPLKNMPALEGFKLKGFKEFSGILLSNKAMNESLSERFSKVLNQSLKKALVAEARGEIFVQNSEIDKAFVQFFFAFKLVQFFISQNISLESEEKELDLDVNNIILRVKEKILECYNKLPKHNKLPAYILNEVNSDIMVATPEIQDAPLLEDFIKSGYNFYVSQQYQEAISSYAEANSIEESAENYQMIGASYFYLGNLRDSLENLKKALEINPKDETTKGWYDAVVGHYYSQQVDESKKVVDSHLLPLSKYQEA